MPSMAMKRLGIKSSVDHQENGPLAMPTNHSVLASSLCIFVHCSLGLTGFDSKMKDTVSKSGVEWHLVTKSFKFYLARLLTLLQPNHPIGY